MSTTLISRSGKSPIQVAIQAAKEAGHVLLSNFQTKKHVKYKGKGNLVTETDILAEKIIVDVLRTEYPNHKILSEETNSTTDTAGYTWIVDPLDGTNNYVYGIPFFCTNIALAIDEEVVLGVTYAPMTRELFQVEKGNGAYLNEAQIRVSEICSLEAAMVGFDLGYNGQQAHQMLKLAIKLRTSVHCMRMIGSSSLGLAYVAAGRVSLYYHRFVYPWDIAPGLLLISEAGGITTNWKGQPATIHSTQIIASNPKIHSEFSRLTG